MYILKPCERKKINLRSDRRRGTPVKKEDDI